MSEILIEREFEELLDCMNHSETDGPHFVRFRIRILRHDAALRAEVTRLKEELEEAKAAFLESQDERQLANEQHQDAQARLTVFMHERDAALARVARLRDALQHEQWCRSCAEDWCASCCTAIGLLNAEEEK